MDEEERKRIAAAIKARRDAAAASAAKASPSGVAVSPSDAAKARIKDDLRKGKSLQDTKFEEPPGMITDAYNAVGRFLTGTVGELPQEGDLDPKLTGLTSGSYGGGSPIQVLAPLMVALGALDTIQNRDERTGTITPLNTALNSGLDVLSLGSANKVRGLIDTTLDTVQGDLSDEGFGADLAENIDERALEQEEIRAANPNIAMATDVAASLATGTAFGKLAFTALTKTAPKLAVNIGRNWYSRVFFGSAVAAGESAAYRLTKDGDLERAASDAAIAMLGGTVMGGAFETAKGLKNILFNVKTPDVISESVADELIRTINIDRQLAGQPAATAADIAADIAKLGPDATLLDVSPGLKDYAIHVLKNEDAGMYGAGLRDLIATRSGFMDELLQEGGTLREAFTAGAVRNLKQFVSDVQARQKKLSPRYEAVKAANTDVKVPVQQFKKNLETLFPKGPAATTGQRALVSLANGYIKAFKATTGKGWANELSLENLLELRSSFSKSADKLVEAVNKKGGAASLDKIDFRDLAQIRGLVADMIHNKVPDLIPLDKIYGNLSSLENAYSAGKEAFASSGDLATVKAFMADSGKSAAAKRAFVEGAKYHMFKVLNKATKTTGIDRAVLENREMFSKMEAMFGKPQVAAMLEAVRPHIIKLRTVEELRAATKGGRASAAITEPRNTTFGKTLDLATMIGGVPGLVSKAGAFGAARRLGLQATTPVEMAGRREMYGNILSKMGEGASEAYRSLEALMQRPINDDGMGALQNAAGIGRGTAQVMSGPNERDGELPQ